MFWYWPDSDIIVDPDLLRSPATTDPFYTFLDQSSGTYLHTQKADLSRVSQFGLPTPYPQLSTDIVEMYFQGAVGSTAAPAIVQLELLEGSTVIATLLVTDLTTSIQSRRVFLTPTEILSITDWSNLSYRFTCSCDRKAEFLYIYSASLNTSENIYLFPDSGLISSVEHPAAGPIAKISCGWDFTQVLTEAGELYSWGWNGSGQCSPAPIVSRETGHTTLRRDNLKDIESGPYHTLAISKDSKLHAWGNNQQGNCWGSAGGDRTDVNHIVAYNVKAISAGYYSSAYVTAGNQLVLYGYNSAGQCWPGAANPLLTSTTPRMSDVQAVSMGQAHAVVLRTNGDVHTWGDNTYGQVKPTDIGVNATDVNTVRLSGVKQIGACYRATVALKENGDLHIWGTNTNGVLGDSGGDLTDMNEVKMSGIERIYTNGTTDTIMAVLEDGTLRSWGENGEHQANYQSGVVITTDMNTERLSGRKVLMGAMASTHAGVVYSDGQVGLWGNNGYNAVNPTVAFGGDSLAPFNSRAQLTDYKPSLFIRSIFSHYLSPGTAEAIGIQRLNPKVYITDLAGPTREGKPPRLAVSSIQTVWGELANRNGHSQFFGVNRVAYFGRLGTLSSNLITIKEKTSGVYLAYPLWVRHGEWTRLATSLSVLYKLKQTHVVPDNIFDLVLPSGPKPITVGSTGNIEIVLSDIQGKLHADGINCTVDVDQKTFTAEGLYGLFVRLPSTQVEYRSISPILKVKQGGTFIAL